MKFNAELTPNSSRDYLEGDGGMGGCDLLCTMTYAHIPGFCCFLACARRVALFSKWQVSILFSDDLAEIQMQMSLILKKCDLPCARRVALWGSGSEDPKNVEK